MANELSEDQGDPPRGGVSSPSLGSFVMPGQEMEVEVMSPPRIVWYWVLKQSIDRLKDAINVERSDRRIEFLFGCVGLAVGTIRDAWIALDTVLKEPEKLTVLDFVFSLLFLVSSIFAFYFGVLAEKKESVANTILSDIFEKEYEANVTRTSPEFRGGTTGGEAGTVREGEPGGGG